MLLNIGIVCACDEARRPEWVHGLLSAVSKYYFHNKLYADREIYKTNSTERKDQNAVDMAHWLLKEEGLFVGSSSAMNVVGAIRAALSSELNDECERDKCVVTVICDGGQRHLTRFWNREFITNWKLQWPGDDEVSWKNRLTLLFAEDDFFS